MPELAELFQQWPPAVINHMMWQQQELEHMRKAAKREYRQKHPAPCSPPLRVGPVVAMSVSWCTVWKGTPQDLMDLIRDGHN